MSYEPSSTWAVLSEFASERKRQEEIHGDKAGGPGRDFPDGTDGSPTAIVASENARMDCEDAFDEGYGTWFHILREEFFEVASEVNWSKLREELIQVGAVACAWIEAGDKREQGQEGAQDESGNGGRQEEIAGGL